MKLILLFILNVAMAKETTEIWSLKNAHYLFVRDSSNNSLVSQDCIQNKKCDALINLNQNKKIKISTGESDGGKNPFAVMCAVGFKMNVVILKGKKNNEASFCKFKDGSMISTHMLDKFI